MCGRYTLAKSLDEIAAYFTAKTGQVGEDGTPLWDWEPNYNIAPGTVVPVIAYDGRKERKVVPMRWGHWDVSADAVLGTMLGSEDLDFYDVGREVGSGRASGAELIRPAGCRQ